MPDYYPAFLDLKGRRAVVVGGGAVALRKSAALRRAGARITVVAPDGTSALRRAAESGRLTWRRRPFRASDLAGAFVAVAATDQPAVNEHVAREAARRRVLCNVVDEPRISSFIVPAVVRRGPICIAISTGGASPTLARRLRGELARAVTPAHGRLAHLLGSLRPEVKRLHGSAAARRRALSRAAAPDVMALLRAGRTAAARRRARRLAGLDPSKENDA